jgi:hypothetical protein
MYINIYVLNFKEKLLTRIFMTWNLRLKYLLYGFNNKKILSRFVFNLSLIILPEGLTNVGRAYGGLEAF